MQASLFNQCQEGRLFLQNPELASTRENNTKRKRAFDYVQPFACIWPCSGDIGHAVSERVLPLRAEGLTRHKGGGGWFQRSILPRP